MIKQRELEAVNEKNSPLHIACQVEDVETILALVKHVSFSCVHKRLTTLNAKNIEGEIPLMLAVMLHKTMAVEVMLKIDGVDFLTRNMSGETLLEVAKRNQFKDIVHMIKQRELDAVNKIVDLIGAEETFFLPRTH